MMQQIKTTADRVKGLMKEAKEQRKGIAFVNYSFALNELRFIWLTMKMRENSPKMANQ